MSMVHYHRRNWLSWRLYLIPLLTDNTAQLGIVPTNLLTCCIQNRCQTNLAGALSGSAMTRML